MKKEKLLILSPGYLIKNARKKKDFIYELLNLVIAISPLKQSINFKLISGYEPKLIIEVKEPVNIEIFKKILTNGNLNLFSRGNFIIQSNSFKHLFLIKDFLYGVSNNDTNLLSYTSERVKDNKNFIEINEIVDIDINFWRYLNSYNIYLNTLAGFYMFNQEINFTHTGEPIKISSKKRQNIWINEQENQEAIFSFKEKSYKSDDNRINMCFSISFNTETESNLIINDSKSYYSHKYNENFKKNINKIIKSQLKPRLINYFKFYLEINVNDTVFSNYNGYLSPENIDLIEKCLIEYLSVSCGDNGFKIFLANVQKSFIDEEDKNIQKRKIDADIRDNVYFKSSNKKTFLMKVPENEQEVVLLTSILASKKLFFEDFEFLDYMTSKGIDSIANYKIAEGYSTQKSAVVEFKLKLESFTDERHPINLIDLVIAWSINKDSFLNKPFKIKKTKTKGIYHIEHDSTSQTTMGLVLKEIDGIVINK